MDQIRKQFKSQFHPQHSLHACIIDPDDYGKSCKACDGDYFGKLCFSCKECGFNLHGGCDKPFTRPTKLEFHECNLFCFKHDEWPQAFKCLICNVERNADLYRCVNCNVNFHLECIPLPSVLQDKCHEHSLSLVDSVNGHDCPEYYCDVCEEQLNLKHHLYYCEKCPYFAHIDCVISYDDTSLEDFRCKDKAEKYSSRMESNKVHKAAAQDGQAEGSSFEGVLEMMMKETIPKEITSSSVPSSEIDAIENSGKEQYITDYTDLRFKFENFAHFLTLCKPSLEEEYLCVACSEVISCQAYYANHKDNFWIHEFCTKLPSEITHPLHPQHPLILLSRQPNYNLDWHFRCRGCEDFSKGFIYHCETCRFSLDTKCGLLLDDFFSKNDREMLEERDKNANIKYFGHLHDLRRFNFRESDKFYCIFCRQIICGSAFSCPDCEFFIHESCSKDLRKVGNHFHPEHTLLTCVNDHSRFCGACGGLTSEFCFSCEECDFNLHVECSKRPSTHPLKHKCHRCNLFYIKDDEWTNEFKCLICKKTREAAVYRCVDCNVNFHLDCIPIPRVMGKCNGDHPLQLRPGVVGHDFPEYYCDVCEEILYPEHHLYYCEECPYFAHIDCVIPQDEVSKDEAETYVVGRKTFIW